MHIYATHDHRKDSGTPTLSHEQPGAPTLLYIDLHLVHEVTSPQAFHGPARARPESAPARISPSPPSTTASPPPTARCPSSTRSRRTQLAQLETNCAEFGIRCLGMHSDQQGIVHVIGPELGLTQPGMTVVCGDSHTATHGAFGALAFGIGTSEVEHVLATQCLLQRQIEDVSRCAWMARCAPASPPRTSFWR